MDDENDDSINDKIVSWQLYCYLVDSSEYKYSEVYISIVITNLTNSNPKAILI